MKNRILALLLSGVLAVSMFAGCGAKMDKTAAVAKANTTEMPLGVANFAVRLSQAQYDDFYVSYFGEEVWRTDMYGQGTTTEDDMKASVLNSLYGMYAVKEHMADYGVELTSEDVSAISAAAEAFISSNSAEAVEALGAEREYVETYLTLLTIENRMYDEIIKGADTNVSAEEAKTSTYSQVYVSKDVHADGEETETHDHEAELAELAETVKAFGADAKANGLKAAAETYGYSVTTGTYNAASSAMLEGIKTALAAMTENGAVSEVIDTENGYYVIQMDEVFDAEATEANRQSIIAERQNNFYTETVNAYVEEMEWSLNKKVWEQVSFDNLFTIYPPVEETEQLESTETE